MVQSTYPDTVPEELYNLTQLADVTLAAGKLSTTNIQKIKAYIECDDTQIVPKPTPIIATINEKFHHSNSNCIKSEYDAFSCTTSSSNPYPKTKINDIKMITSDKSHSVIKSTINCDVSLCFSAAEFEPRKNVLNGMKTMSSLSSSSEDDSTYQNYSHKIFDKRRARKLSYQSDDSGLDVYNNRSNNFNNMLGTAEYYGGIDDSGGGDAGVCGGIRETTDDSMMSNSETDSTDFPDACKTIDANGDDVHVCPECSKKYSTSSNLARHRQTHR